MIKPGHIEIGKEVLFVYYELPKPQEKAFVLRLTIGRAAIFKQRDWVQALKEYEASKRSVEVSSSSRGWYGNKYFVDMECETCHSDLIIELEHNQPCEANVKGGKAMITKIT